MDQLLGLFERGGPTMYAIAACAAVGLTLFIERILATRTLAPDVRSLGRRVRDASAAADVPPTPCPANESAPRNSRPSYPRVPSA